MQFELVANVAEILNGQAAGGERAVPSSPCMFVVAGLSLKIRDGFTCDQEEFLGSV